MGFVAKSTTVVASHSVTVNNNESYLITSPTPHGVIKYSIISPFIRSTFKIFVTISITRIKMPLKNNFIPLLWCPKNNFLMSSLLCSFEISLPCIDDFFATLSSFFYGFTSCFFEVLVASCVSSPLYPRPDLSYGDL
jgi:hypothetical protein